MVLVEPEAETEMVSRAAVVPEELVVEEPYPLGGHMEVAVVETTTVPKQETVVVVPFVLSGATVEPSLPQTPVTYNK
jgi:hypothetical protein